MDLPHSHRYEYRYGRPWLPVLDLNLVPVLVKEEEKKKQKKKMPVLSDTVSNVRISFNLTITHGQLCLISGYPDRCLKALEYVPGYGPYPRTGTNFNGGRVGCFEALTRI